MNLIQSTILQKIPNSKRNVSGWTSFNCPACIHNGQSKPDNRKRAGLQFTGDSVRFSCFNCGFKTGWQPGQLLSSKLSNLLKWLGTTNEEIAEIKFQVLKIKESNDYTINNDFKPVYNYNIVKLPNESKHINEWAKEDNPPLKFIQALDYIESRNVEYLSWFDDFHWSPELPDRIIIPLKHNNLVYGWSARLTRKQRAKVESKYKMNDGDKFLFGADRLFDEYRKYVIITEGIFDAIAVSGVATQGNTLTDMQIKWITDSNKTIVLLPDRDASGQKLIDIAIQQNWLVSFPDIFKLNIKDAADAVNVYGRILTIKSIIESAEDSTLKINLLRKNWK